MSSTSEFEYSDEEEYVFSEMDTSSEDDEQIEKQIHQEEENRRNYLHNRLQNLVSKYIVLSQLKNSYTLYWKSKYYIEPTRREYQQIGRKKYLEIKMNQRKQELLQQYSPLQMAATKIQYLYKKTLIPQNYETFGNIRNDFNRIIIKTKDHREHIHYVAYDVHQLYEKLKDDKYWFDPKYGQPYSKRVVKRIKRLADRKNIEKRSYNLYQDKLRFYKYQSQQLHLIHRIIK